MVKFKQKTVIGQKIIKRKIIDATQYTYLFVQTVFVEFLSKQPKTRYKSNNHN